MLLVDINEKVLIPINGGVFEISQFKSQKKLNRMHKGSYIIYPDGAIKEIDSISINGYYGDWFWGKLFCILNSTHSISVKLKPMEVDLDDLKSQLIEFLSNDALSQDPYLPQSSGIASVIAKLRIANDTKELYSVFEVPDESDCLDAL
jgi:hypothetical protein